MPFVNEKRIIDLKSEETARSCPVDSKRCSVSILGEGGFIRPRSFGPDHCSAPLGAGLHIQEGSGNGPRG
jgi:hypothetical protein